MKFDNTWFLKRMEEVRPKDYKEYVFKDEYVNSTTKLTAIHLPCNSEIKIIPSSFLSKRKTGCPICSQKKVHDAQRKTHEEYQRQLPEGIIALTKYTGAYDKITVHCFFCDSTYERVSREAIRGCNRCNRRFNRTIEDVKKEVKKETKGLYEVVSWFRFTRNILY